VCVPGIAIACSLTIVIAHGEAGLDVLASDCAARLGARLARPERDADYWSTKLAASGLARF